MDADPRGAGRGVHECVEDRPVGDRIGSVAHGRGLAVGRRNRARVEVVATDHHRRGNLARSDELVDREPSLRAVTEAEPADPRGEPLERHPIGSQLEPSLEERVVGEELT
jgi:hypothetical protein